MIKKAVIAAAGRGTRMLHLTKNKPKHLIHVKGKPFLYYLLSNLKEAGITEVLLVVGHKKEAMEEFVRDYGSKFGITVADQFGLFGTEMYGSAIPIKAAKDFVGNDQFLAIYGDNLYSPSDIRALLEKNDRYHYVSVLEHQNPEKYGVISVRDGFVSDWHEKPKVFISNLINTGLYKFTPEIFEHLEDVRISPRGEYELTDVVQTLAKAKKVKARILEDYWFDFGNPGDIVKVSRFLNDSDR